MDKYDAQFLPLEESEKKEIKNNIQDILKVKGDYKDKTDLEMKEIRRLALHRIDCVETLAARGISKAVYAIKCWNELNKTDADIEASYENISKVMLDIIKDIQKGIFY